MKKLLFALLVTVLVSLSVSASPLLYKGEFAFTGLMGESQMINVGRASKIRVFVKTISKINFDKPERPLAMILGIAETDIFFIASDQTCKGFECIILGDVPSPQIKIRVYGPGKYRVFVWGS